MAKFITLDNLNKFKKNSDQQYMSNKAIDNIPTDNSENLITSGGVKEYVDNAVLNSGGGSSEGNGGINPTLRKSYIEVDTSLRPTETNLYNIPIKAATGDFAVYDELGNVDNYTTGATAITHDYGEGTYAGKLTIVGNGFDQTQFTFSGENYEIKSLILDTINVNSYIATKCYNLEYVEFTNKNIVFPTGWSNNLANNPKLKTIVFPDILLQTQSGSFRCSANEILENVILPKGDYGIHIGTFIGRTFTFPEGFTGSISSTLSYGNLIEHIEYPSTLQNLVIPTSNNTALKSITLKSNRVVTVSGVSNLPSNLQAIYVPAHLVNEYKVATNWVSIADKIFAISPQELSNSSDSGDSGNTGGDNSNVDLSNYVTFNNLATNNTLRKSYIEIDTSLKTSETNLYNIPIETATGDFTVYDELGNIDNYAKGATKITHDYGEGSTYKGKLTIVGNGFVNVQINATKDNPNLDVLGLTLDVVTYNNYMLNYVQNLKYLKFTNKDIVFKTGWIVPLNACDSLRVVEFPEYLTQEQPQNSRFRISDCSALDTILYPKSDTGIYLYGLSGLQRLIIPEGYTGLLYGTPFGAVDNLEYLELPSTLVKFAGSLNSNTVLKSITLKAPRVVTLSSINALPSNIQAIYVPAYLVDEYKAATNWISIADKIFAISPKERTRFIRDTIVNDWVTESPYTDYPFEAIIWITGITSNTYAEIVFSADDSISGNYLPICETGEGYIRIYSKSNAEIIIPTIKLTEGV